MQPDFDCLIVGGGMVGASLACALDGAGLRVGVIEAVPFAADGQPSYDDRGLAISTASQRILDGIGVWSGIAAPTPIRQIHISERGRFWVTRLAARDYGLPVLGHVVIARELGRALMRRLQVVTSTEVFCPATLTSLEIAGAVAQVGFRQEGGDRSVTARLVVVADGARSRARELLGIAARIHDYRQSAIVANVTPERPHANTAFERFTPEGPLALMPQPDNRCGVVMGVPQDRVEAVLALSDAEFIGLLRRKFGGRLGDFVRVSSRQAYPLRLVVADRIAGTRVVVLGNAAHAIHPNAAQGLNLGLRDVAALAELLHAAGRGGGDVGDDRLTAAFAAERQADHRRIIRLSDGLARLFYNELLPLKWLRGGAMLAMAALPPLRRQLVELASGLKGPAPRLVRGLPL